MYLEILFNINTMKCRLRLPFYSKCGTISYTYSRDYQTRNNELIHGAKNTGS